MHAQGIQLSLDTLTDECPGEIHVHALVVPASDTTLAEGLEHARWGVPTGLSVRRIAVVRNGGLHELLLRSSKAITNKSSRVVRAFGGARGRRTAVETRPVVAPKPVAEAPVRCPGCGEMHPGQEYGYYRPIDNSGRCLEGVPWDDEEVHTVADGESDVFWERIGGWQALERG